MAKAIGIDLGTTNSAAGLKAVRTEIIVNAEGDRLTPSVVALRAGVGAAFGKEASFVVGKHAQQWLVQDPENTVTSIKRLMGRHFNDPDIQRLIQEQRFSYTIKALDAGSERSLAVLLGGKEYTPEEISSKIIEKIRADCEKHLGAPVDSAVVTVPAYFNDKQTHMTRQAVARAGLKVLRLLPEPTAAAISFGVDNLPPGETQTILVFDLGGGTFDISILTVCDGQFIEQGKGGDMWMGGDDMDALLGQYVYHQMERAHGIDALATLVDALPKEKRNRFLSTLKRQVEMAKIQLSTREKAVIEVLGLLRDAEGELLDVEITLTREHLETLLLPLAERAVTLVKQVIASTHFELELIDKVVMVGGASSIPLLIRRMKTLFGEAKVLMHPRPMLAITEGAAIMAHRLADQHECPGCGKNVPRDASVCGACQHDLAADRAKAGVVDIVHTTSHDYFLELEDGSDHLLVPRHMPLPFQTQAAFRLVDPEQNLAHFRFFNRLADKKESIGDLWLSFDMDDDDGEDATPPTDGFPEVVLDFGIDEDNIITVTAALKGRPEVTVGRTLSRGKRDEQLFLEMARTIDRINQERRDYYVAYEFLQRSIPLATTLNQIIHPETGEENRETSQRAAFMLDVAQKLLAQNETPSANGFYAESIVTRYAFALGSGAEAHIRHRLDLFLEANARAPVDQILKARKALMDAIDQQPVAVLLKDVDDALELVLEEDPAQAPRLEQYAHDLTQAILKGDKAGYGRMAKEVQPELKRVFFAEGKKRFRIWKEIRK